MYVLTKKNYEYVPQSKSTLFKILHAFTIIIKDCIKCLLLRKILSQRKTYRCFYVTMNLLIPFLVCESTANYTECIQFQLCQVATDFKNYSYLLYVCLRVLIWYIDQRNNPIV
jgi:hypothetical protein